MKFVLSKSLMMIIAVMLFSSFFMNSNAQAADVGLYEQDQGTYVDDYSTPPADQTSTTFGIVVGFAPSPEVFDAGIIVFFDDIGVTASYLFDDNVDWGGRVGIGKQITEKYTVFANAVVTGVGDETNWGYGIDVAYNLTSHLSLTLGVESERKFRVGTYWTF